MFCKDLSQTVHLWGGVWTSNGIAHYAGSYTGSKYFM